MLTHQLQVERRTAKARRPKTDVLPLDHATNLVTVYLGNGARQRRGYRTLLINNDKLYVDIEQRIAIVISDDL